MSRVENGKERAALPLLRLDLQHRPMPQQHMLDDGQAEAGTLGFTGSAFIDAIKAFSEAGDVFGADADAAVLDRELRPFRGLLPLDVDVATIRRVADGVGDEVAEGAAQLVGVAIDVGTIDVEGNLVAAAGERVGLLPQLSEQVADIDLLSAQRIVDRFQPRQGQHVLDQVLHALALLDHQLEVPHAHRLFEIRLGLGDFQEAVDDGQRRAQFVRGVGDEIAAHHVDALGLGHIVSDQDLAAILERDDLDDQLAILDVERQRLLVVAEDDVVDKGRIADQIGDAHALVARVAEAQVLFGSRIAPFEEQHVVHDGDAVRQQAHGLAEAGQPFTEFLAVALVVAAQAIQAREDIGPCTPAIGQFFAFGMIEPAREQIQIIELNQHQHQQEQQAGRQPGGQAKEIADHCRRRQYDDKPQGSRDPEQQLGTHRQTGLFFGKHIAYTAHGLDQGFRLF